MDTASDGTWEVEQEAMREPTRVMIANELLSYREAIARVFRSLRSGEIEVAAIEPKEINREVERLRPDLAVCSQITFMVELRVPIWVELYSDCGSRSTVSIHGKTSTVEDMQFPDLLALLDHVRSPAD